MLTEEGVDFIYIKGRSKNLIKRIGKTGGTEVLMIEWSVLTVRVKSIVTVWRERNVTSTLREKWSILLKGEYI